MSIKRLETGNASFPRIGILRKGAPKPETGNKPGADLEYFRFDPEDGPEKAAILEQFHAAYGKEPRDIEVFLPYATPAENFEAWQEQWVAGGLVHRCDGETMVLWQNKDGSYSHTPKPCTGGCTPVGRLKVILPALRRMAYVTVQTTSINDIITLSENLRAAHMLRGDLRGIPFILKRRPRDISTPGSNGKRVRREKWLLSIEAKPSWVELQLQAMAQAALPAPALALPDGKRVLDTETGELVEVSAEEVETETGAEPEQSARAEPSHWSADPEVMTPLTDRLAKHGITIAQAEQWLGGPFNAFNGTPQEAQEVIAKHHRARVKAQQAQPTPAPLTQPEQAELAKYAQSIGLGTAYIADGLDVENIHEWTGGLDAAKAKLKRFVDGEPPTEQPALMEG